MFFEVQPQTTGASPTTPCRVEATTDVLKLFVLSPTKWKKVEGIKEEWQGWVMDVGGWGRMFDNHHVLILLNRDGEYHTTWRMYVDGEMVYHMKDIVTMMGSGQNAMRRAEAYMKSERMKIVVNFESTMNNIIKQYRVKNEA